MATLPLLLVSYKVFLKIPLPGPAGKQASYEHHEVESTTLINAKWPLRSTARKLLFRKELEKIARQFIQLNYEGCYFNGIEVINVEE
jgi:hypothetical protein